MNITRKYTANDVSNSLTNQVLTNRRNKQHLSPGVLVINTGICVQRGSRRPTLYGEIDHLRYKLKY